MAGNLETKLKACLWECLRHLPNIKKANGQGLWHAFPRLKKRLSFKKLASLIPNLSFFRARGPPFGIGALAFLFAFYGSQRAYAENLTVNITADGQPVHLAHGVIGV